MLKFQNMLVGEIRRLMSEQAAFPAEEVILTRPPSSDMGDLALPCFSMAKKMRKNPVEIANSIKDNLSQLSFIEKIEIKGGYLNFFIKREVLFKEIIEEVKHKKDKYGSSMSGMGKSALIEHTSINPNASPHVGRARNAMIGDVLVRLMKFEGYEVDTHYFVNDIGKQIAMLLLGAQDVDNVGFKDLLDIYVDINNKLEQNPELEEKVFELLYKLENGDVEVRDRFRKLVDICINGQVKILGELGIKYNTFKYESDYVWSRRTDEILKELERSGKLEEAEDGRMVVNLSDYNLPMKEPYLVVTRSDKTSLYPTRDIAYTIDKVKTGSDKNIIVLGEDQKLYFKEICSVLDILGYEAPSVVHYSFVLLADGKMATRKGHVVLLEDFMREALTKVTENISKRNAAVDEAAAKAIAYGAVKYAFLKVDNNKNITFDWETALSFDGDTGPYLQYSVARISSIIKKYGKELPEEIDFSLFKENAEYELVKELGEFEAVIKRTLDDMSPHILANYVFSLTKRFSTFYHECPVLNASDEELKKARLVLIDTVRQVIKNSLQLLGIDIVENM